MPAVADPLRQSPPLDAAGSRRQWRSLLVGFAALMVFFGVSAAGYIRRYQLHLLPAAAIFLCLQIMLALFLAPGFAAPRAWLARRLRGPAGAAASAGLFALPYLIYAAGTGDFRWIPLLKLLGLAGVPFLLFACAPVRRRDRLNWQDAVALLWLALPVLFRQLRGIWNVPVNLDFLARLYVLSAGAWAFLLWRGAEGVGYEFRFSWRGLRDALLNFACFAAVALPLGFSLGFIGWNPRWAGPGQFVFDFVTIIVFIAVPEELFFRGLLQNLLEGSWSSPWRAQAVASVLFGLTHILHAPFPNWRYVILASIAGWFYGAAWRNTRSLTASSTTHALVDAVWHTWFTRPAG